MNWLHLSLALSKRWFNTSRIESIVKAIVVIILKGKKAQKWKGRDYINEKEIYFRSFIKFLNSFFFFFLLYWKNIQRRSLSSLLASSVGSAGSMASYSFYVRFISYCCWAVANEEIIASLFIYLLSTHSKRRWRRWRSRSRWRRLHSFIGWIVLSFVLFLVLFWFVSGGPIMRTLTGLQAKAGHPPRTI